MFTCHFIIFCLIFSEIKADFWCEEEHLESLIQCITATKLRDHEVTEEEIARRYQCAKDADCTLKPWQILNSKIRILIAFVECMDDGNGKWMPELYCRRDLAKELPKFAPKLFELYYFDLLGQGIPGQGIPGQRISGQGVSGQGNPESGIPRPGPLSPDGIPTEPTPKPREARIDKVVIANRPNNGGVIQFQICNNLAFDCCESRNILVKEKHGNCKGFRIDYPEIPTIQPFFTLRDRFVKSLVLPCVEFWMEDKQTQLVCKDLEIKNFQDIPKNKCQWIISPYPTCNYNDE